MRRNLGMCVGPLTRPLGDTRDRMWSYIPALATALPIENCLGFSVGGGMEGRLSYWLPPNWTWKLEYLYLDLGSLDTQHPSFWIPDQRFCRYCRYDHHAHAFHRQHRARRAELSIPLI